MSSDPADRLRNAYAAFNSGAGLDWSLIDPSIEHDQTKGLFLDGVFYGPEGVRAALEEVESDWEGLSYELVEVVQLGDRVLVLLRMTARVRDSQAELDAQVAHVWEFRDGRAVRWDVYGDHASAQQAFNGVRAAEASRSPQPLL
jgi:ketosteroid isomerase-like protein